MKFNQKTKGVISIFLLITFSTVFIFSGILVDGGRMHMAKALATSSLDNAASSALSYYDELLLDLYGLFAMAEVPAGTDSGDDESSDDDALVEAINKRMEKYFRQTLGLITTDEKQTDAMVKKLMESFDGYDFQVDSFSSGTNLNLGQTEVLKTQIVEHMKYRAPLQLVNVEYGFLDGLQEIFDMKEILKSTKDKNDIVKRYKSAVFEGNTVVNLIIDFLRSSCTTYVAHPVQGVALESYFNDIVIERLQQLYTDYETICQQEEDSTSTETDESNTEISTENDAASDTDFAQQKQEILDEVRTLLQGIRIQMEDVHTRANTLFVETEGYDLRVKAYLKKMEQYVEALTDFAELSEKNKQVTEPTIKQAKAAAGKVVLNKGILGSATSSLKAIKDVSENDKDIFYDELYEKVKDSFEDETFEKQKILIYIQGTSYYKTIKEKMEKLKLACQSSEEKYVTTNSSSSHYTPETNVDADKLGVSSRALRTDIAAGGILEGATSSENSSEGGLNTNSFDVDGEYDFDKANNVLDNGINLIDSLSEFFSKGISNVYVNEYIMAYCRNYVHHYSMRDDKTVDNSGKVSDKDKYDSVIAKQFCEKDDINKRYISSEVEYILIGANNEYGNIAGVAGEILLLRTVCNLVAIFSDGNAYQQAGMICSWAGPLQPLVTFALMVAWAVAESAMEVADIMQGEKVALYRKFSEWDLNVQGAISKLVGEATEFVANYVMAEVEEHVKLAWSEFEEQYDAALYDSFVGNATSSGLRADTGNAEANQMINKLNTFVGSVNYSMNDALKTEALEVVTAEYTSLKRNAITKVKQGAMKTAQSWSLGIESNTNTSNVADSGNKKLKLGYKDYIRLLLLLEDETTKLQRLQEVIQMNIRYQQRDKGKPTEELFQMQYAWVNVYAEANCSIKYLFMTEAFLPSAWLNEAGPDGRFHFTVKTNISY